MIDHVVLGVEDIVISRAFYEQALAPLGVKVVLDLPGYVGFGDGGKPWFFVATRAPSQRVHVAFSATAELWWTRSMDRRRDRGRTGQRRAWACARSITRTTTVRSFTTPTATTSRLSAIGRVAGE